MACQIDHTSGDKSAMVKLGSAGGFTANYIIGMDGRTPVKVDNNWSWNLIDGFKAKAKTLSYQDGFGNKFRARGRTGV